MLILSHRANLHGPDQPTENTLVQVTMALESGFSIETDIRRAADRKLYISHNLAPFSNENDAKAHASLWRSHPQNVIALNVKEPRCNLQLIDFIRQFELYEQVFLFDFELLEEHAGETARAIHAADERVRVAARVSDRYGETVEQASAIDVASIIWLDEFDTLWVRNEHIGHLKGLGRTIYAISPEIHGFPLGEAEDRWRQFQRWGVDGICTDFPIRAKAVLGL